jgi:hypothetical protein
MWVSDTERRPYIEFKKSVSRADCNLKPSDHDYYNTDLFDGMLRGAVKEVQQGREWQYLDKLPAGITVDNTKFLAVVTIYLQGTRWFSPKAA